MRIPLFGLGVVAALIGFFTGIYLLILVGIILAIVGLFV